MKRTLSDADLTKVRTAAQLIESNLKLHLTIPDLSVKVCLNAFKLKLGFKQEYGVGPYTYLQQKRMEKAKQMLEEGLNIRNVAISLGFKGFQAENSFIKSFKKYMAQSPGAWRQEHAKMKDEESTAA